METEYNCNFGCWDLLTVLLKEKGTHESITIHSQALCQVQDHQAQRQTPRDLRKSETQTEAGLVYGSY